MAVVGQTMKTAIIDTVLDYFEGWFDGNVERMKRAPCIRASPSARSKPTAGRSTRRPLTG